MWFFALVLACSQPTPSDPPKPELPTAAQAAAPDVLYSFLIEETPGSWAGTRVFSDGRLEVATTGPDKQPAWRADRVLSVAKITELQAALDAPAVERTPEVLPPDPKAQPDAPPAVWQVRSHGRLRTLKLNHYGGVVPRTLDPIRQMLAPPPELVLSTWTARTGSTRRTADLTCPIARSGALSPILRRMNNKDLPEATVTTPLPAPLVAVEQHEGALAWTVTVHDDGRVAHKRADGTVRTLQLPKPDLDAIRAAVDAAPWNDAEALCKEGSSKQDLPKAPAATPSAPAPAGLH